MSIKLNTKPNTKLLISILIWLPFLCADRLLKSLAVAIAPSLEHWEVGDILFRDMRNDALVMGIQGSVPTANMLGVLVFVVAIALCHFLRLPTKILWPLAPFTFAAVSNMIDSLIWGAVSDPIVVGMSSSYAVGFNLADVLCIVGVVCLTYNVLVYIYQTYQLYYSLEASRAI